MMTSQSTHTQSTSYARLGNLPPKDASRTETRPLSTLRSIIAWPLWVVALALMAPGFALQWAAKAIDPEGVC